ncbi:hypothetical protein FQN54_008424 [Arachnomyces sp. PD_36]|nr:hypothetical protein FQN54_008424 [Arachnomyces sp. PD_36]
MGIPMLRNTVEPVCPKTFTKELGALRKQYEELRAHTNLTRFCGRPMISSYRDTVNGREYHVFRYDDGSQYGQCIRIADFPGSLAGSILRLHKRIPAVDGDHEIVKNEVIPLPQGHPPLCKTETPCAPEDLTDVLALLSVIDPVDLSVHTIKHKCEVRRAEIVYHLKCQRGSCPGSPISPYISRLLGKTPDGHLVFERLLPGVSFKAFTELRDLRRFLLHLISGLKVLHSLGILQRNLGHSSLFVRFPGGKPELVIGDLGSRYPNTEAPEFPTAGPLPDEFTEKSDIYDIGDVIKYMVYCEPAITNVAQGKVPAPLQTIVEACQQVNPDLRPGLGSLQQMVENIREEGGGSEEDGSR